MKKEGNYSLEQKLLELKTEKMEKKQWNQSWFF